jgi:hypothetical protein
MRSVPALFHLTFAASLVLALRPVASVDRLVEEAFAPLRVLTRVARPLVFVGGDAVEARQLEVRAAAAASYGLAIAEDLLAASRPAAPELLTGRRLVPARVLRRPEGERDEIVLAPWSLEGIVVGLPVASADHYLGRIVAIDTELHEVTARLVTGLSVGARLVPLVPDGSEPVRFVVGGVVLGALPIGGGEAPVRLVAHHPSRPDDALAGHLVVDEYLADLDPFHALARGFVLGDLERGASENEWHVVPRVDFLHGVSQVVVVCPPSAPAPTPPPHPIVDDHWRLAWIDTPGDPAPWRASLVCRVADGERVPIGAAVVRDARLVGRVTSSTRFGIDVALLADPGVGLPVAGVPLDVPGALPRVLGRIVSLGRDPSTGRVRFHLRDALPFEVDGVAQGTRVRVRLVTGAGEVGLPAGLLVGETELVTGSSGGRGRRFELWGTPDPYDSDSALFVRAFEAVDGADPAAHEESAR